MFLGIEAEIGGPIVDGRAVRALSEFEQQAQHDVALRYGITVVRELQRVVRDPTPYYWTQIDVQSRGPVDVVTDQGVIYGPWLAGIGSRNYPKTRFKGYAHWRRAADEMRRRTPEITQRLFKRFLQRMGG